MIEINSLQQRADRVYTVLNGVLPDPQKPHLDNLYSAIQAQTTIAGELTRIFDDQLSEARIPVNNFLGELRDLERGQGKTWDEISPHPLRDWAKGRLFEVIIPRIRVKLSQKRLPWYLHWMQRYALDEHPKVTIERGRIKNELVDGQQNLERRSEQVNREKNQRLEEIKRHTDTGFRRLLVFAHNQAAASFDVAVTFVKGFPEQRDSVGWAYAALNELTLVGSEQYEDFLASQRLSTHQLRVSYEKLPQTVRQAWRRWLKESYEGTILESIATRGAEGSV